MITVFTGPMFSGKTEHLIEAASGVKGRILSVKHSMDGRYDGKDIASHSGMKLDAVPVDKAFDILKLSDERRPDAVLIDEAQFFGESLVSIVQELELRGVDVFIACLDMASNRSPFGIAGDLMAVADSVVKLHAKCACCGGHAKFSKRIVKQDGLVLVGGALEYSPRCPMCFDMFSEDKA